MDQKKNFFTQGVPLHRTHDDPLLACLVKITELVGNPCSAEHLVSGLPLRENRLTADLLERAAARAHCETRLIRKNLEHLPSAVLPAILFLEHGRFCVLQAIDGQTATVIYPENTLAVEIPLAELLEQYTGLAAFIQLNYQVENRSKVTLNHADKRNWFWSAIFANWRLYRDALAAAFLINVFALSMPLFTLNVYDRVVPNNAVETLWVLAIGITIVLFFNWLLTFARARVVDKAGSQVDIQVSAQIMEKVLDLKMESRPASVGAFAANLRSFEAIRDFIASASLTTLVDLPFMLVFFAALFWISPYLVIPPLVAAVVILMVSFFSQLKMRKLSRSLFQAGAQRNAVLVESLAGLETIKVLNAQGQAQLRWEQSTEQIAAVNLKLRAVSSGTMGFIQMTQQLVTVAVVVIGVHLVSESLLSLGGIIASSMLAGRSLASLGSVSGLMLQYYNAQQSLNAIDIYMQLPTEHQVDKNYLPRPVLQGNIQFKKVSFSYPKTDYAVLENINLTVKQGEKIGIIGRVGSGKTTLAKLILGLYQPTSGSILIDDIDSRQIDPADLRRSMGYVSQDPVLFYGSLKHNLTMGAPFATSEQVIEAAKLAGVDRFASKHPDGYDMLISERGESLSGGQRQAIAVARALLSNPSVLLLDEPSSHLDNQSEMILRGHLKVACENRTVVLITHRMALLDLVDRLIVVDNGAIVADGPKEQIIAALREGQINQRKG